MINKVSNSISEALVDIADGATIMIGGFGSAGIPLALIDGLIEQGARELTVITNNSGNGDFFTINAKIPIKMAIPKYGNTKPSAISSI